MFGLLRRARRQRATAPSSRLMLEGLEFRGSPASLLADPTGSSDPGTTMIVMDNSQDPSALTTATLDSSLLGGGSQVQLPDISNFNFQIQQDGSYLFQGHVDAFTTNGLTVHLNGLESVTNIVVNCDQNGNFQFRVLLNGTSSDNGTVDAVAQDILGQQSTVAAVVVRQS
jgi:hypothetical protein